VLERTCFWGVEPLAFPQPGKAGREALHKQGVRLARGARFGKKLGG
jgi:hypothetical protein